MLETSWRWWWLHLITLKIHYWGEFLLNNIHWCCRLGLKKGRNVNKNWTFYLLLFCVLSVLEPIILELFIPTCLRNLLTNYHENYISHLTPPAAKTAIKEVIKLSPPTYRQDPLRRQLSNNYQDENVSFQPPKYAQNPLLRKSLCGL